MYVGSPCANNFLRNFSIKELRRQTSKEKIDKMQFFPRCFFDCSVVQTLMGWSAALAWIILS